MSPCDEILATLLRGDDVSRAGREHAASCAACDALLRVAATPDARLAIDVVEPPAGLGARVLRAAAPLLAEYRSTATTAAEMSPALASPRATGRQAAPPPWTLAPARLDGARLARALVPAVLLFPLLVLFDVLLLRTAHDVLASLLPLTLTNYLVASYAAALAALVCLTFGAIPLLVQRQAGLAPWKEGHV